MAVPGVSGALLVAVITAHPYLTPWPGRSRKVGGGRPVGLDRRVCQLPPRLGLPAINASDGRPGSAQRAAGGFASACRTPWNTWPAGRSNPPHMSASGHWLVEAHAAASEGVHQFRIPDVVTSLPGGGAGSGTPWHIAFTAVTVQVGTAGTQPSQGIVKNRADESRHQETSGGMTRAKTARPPLKRPGTTQAPVFRALCPCHRKSRGPGQRPVFHSIRIPRYHAPQKLRPPRN